jgi:hypothetical protein
MVFEKVKVRAKGWTGPLQHEYIPLFTLRLNFNEHNGAFNGKRRMGLLREGHHLNKGGPKVK